MGRDIVSGERKFNPLTDGLLCHEIVCIPEKLIKSSQS